MAKMHQLTHGRRAEESLLTLYGIKTIDCWQKPNVKSCIVASRWRCNSGEKQNNDGISADIDDMFCWRL